MGYYTNYTLEILPKGNQAEIIYSIFEDDYYFTSEDSIKWYSQEPDCIEVSKRFPNYLIVVTGFGEENADVWKAAYFNGKKVWNWSLTFELPKVPQEILDLVK
jgi:hypothetical protein